MGTEIENVRMGRSMSRIDHRHRDRGDSLGMALEGGIQSLMIEGRSLEWCDQSSYQMAIGDLEGRRRH